MGHETSTSALHIWQHVRSGILGVILIFSLISNSLLILVLRKMKSRRSNKDCASHNIEKSYMYLLFHLAVADMLGVILNIPFDIIRNGDVKYYFSDAGCKILGPFQLAATTAQAGTYVALSYHRFRAIVYPIRANLTVCKSIIMMCVIWSLSFCLSLPFSMVLELNGTAINACDEKWPEERLSSIIYTFSIFIVQYAVPVILMAVFYISIARTLHGHRIAKELIQVPTQEDVRSHRHIVKMLVTIVMVYSVCMLPHHLIWIIHGLHTIEKTPYKVVSSVSYLFTYSNSVANPVIFFSYNKESRYHLKRFYYHLCCCGKTLDVPFEIKKWSATWTGNSKSETNHQHEKHVSKTDQVKLDQLFLSKPGDSDLGVSLPWEAQVINSHASTEEYQSRDGDNLSPTEPDTLLVISDPSLPTITLTDTSESCALNDRSPLEDSQIPEDTIEPIVIVAGRSEAKSDKVQSDEEDEGCIDIESSSSEDGTSRVQKLIKNMMEDIANEMKEDEKNNNRINGLQCFDNNFPFTDSSSNGDCSIDTEPENGGLSSPGNFSSSQDLAKEMISYLDNSQHETERDLRVLQEHLRNLPETRM